MTRNQKLYFHLIISIALIPLILNGNNILKVLIILYSIWLTVKIDAIYLPALTVLASYMPNSYPIYFTILIILIFNYNESNKYNVKMFFFLLALFPIVVFYIYMQIIVMGYEFGHSLNLFQYYFSIFAFFYGILIAKSIDSTILKSFIITFILLYCLNLLVTNYIDGSLIRLLFYCIPLFFLFIYYEVFIKKDYIFSLLIFLFIFLLVSYDELTFTLLFTTLLSIIILRLFKYSNIIGLKIITGWPIFIFLFSIIIIGILFYDGSTFYPHYNISMKEVNSLELFLGRFLFKFFNDRIVLWSGSIYQIMNSITLLPTIDIDKIMLYSFQTKKLTVVFNYHSHNIFIELLRSNGIMMGSIISVVLIRLTMLGGLFFFQKRNFSYLHLLLAVAISNVIIGGMSGIYILLNSYALFGITIIGIGYGRYKSEEYQSTIKV